MGVNYLNELFCPEKTCCPSRAGPPCCGFCLLRPPPPPNPALQPQTRLPVLSCRAREPQLLCAAVRVSRTLVESSPCFGAGFNARRKLLFGVPDIGFFFFSKIIPTPRRRSLLVALHPGLNQIRGLINYSL